MSELTTEEKAAHWDALMSCQRIRTIGSAKLGDPELQHIGIEFWAKYPGEFTDSRDGLLTFVAALLPNICPKGGEHKWGIDGQHSNEYCKKCFKDKPKGD